MGLREAFYLASTDKIYGCRENYIVKFNATTGLQEAEAKVTYAYGPMRITGTGSDLYVSSFADRTVNQFDLVPTQKNIWRVDPTTLAVTDPLDWDGQMQTDSDFISGSSFGDWLHTYGPHLLGISGGYLYFCQTYSTNVNWGRIKLDATDLLPYGPSKGNWMPEQLDFYADGSPLILHANQNEIELHPATLSGGEDDRSFDTSGTDRPIGVAYCPVNDRTYAVTGDETLWRANDWALIAALSCTKLNLAPIYANVEPMRVRYSAVDEKLYIPCQVNDVVLVIDPALDVDDAAHGTAIEDLNSPHDVVVTDSKIFAVQSGPVGLVDITPS